MSEADIVERLAEFMPNYLAGVSLAFTVVSAYLAALFYFLRKAGFGLRFLAFFLFTAIMASLGLFVYTSVRYFEALRNGFAELDVAGELSPVGVSISEILSFQSVEALIFTGWAIGGGAYVILFYMTFLHPWRSAAKSEEHDEALAPVTA